ncbi:sensor histidine kinase [Arcobacter sp.]|uniref:sensor histidine kinase n=1 Tax=Arcobacter sp. TaxID=1872629 RepID=UPI003D0DCED2
MNYKVCILFLFLLVFQSNLFSNQKKENIQILIINSYHKDFQWSDELIDGVKKVLNTNKKIEITTLYMDSKRINSSEYYNSLLRIYKLQLKNRKYNIVLLVDKFAFEFALKNYNELFFNNEKLVFSGIEKFSPEEIEKYNLSDRVFGVMEKRAIEGIIATIDTMMPKLKKLYIINDRSSNAKDTNILIQKAINKYKSKFEIEYIRKSTLKELKQRFSEHKSNEAIFFVRFYNGDNNEFYKNREIGAAINSFKLPTFVTDTLFLKDGALGGKLLSISHIGEATGELVLDLINKPNMKPLITVDEKYQYLFNYKKIKEFNLNPANINSPYSLVNTPESFFDKNRKLINIVFMISPILILLIFMLVYTLYLHTKTAKHQEFIIQQSKLAEIGEIISSITHQWKEPLIEISTLVQEHIGSNSKSKDEDKKYIDDIMVQIYYMTDTINDFHQFIKPSSNKTTFNIKDAIIKMMTIVHHSMKYNYIDINIEIAKNTKLLVDGYPNELMQTMLNIVNNAKEAILEKRKNIEMYDGKIDINIFNNKKYVQIEIQDNGCGIDKICLKKIFDPYFTTKSKGYGIGLYMTKVIIEEKMNGKISVEPMDVGTKFVIKLELSNENFSIRR